MPFVSLVDHEPLGLHQISVERNFAPGSDMRDLGAQRRFVNASRSPRFVKRFKTIAVEVPAGFGKELEIVGHGNDIFMTLPLLAHRKIPKNLGRTIGLSG